MKAITIKLPPAGVIPVGIIQFVHGMCEHRKRYESVMDYFCEHGYICAIADLRGHGENIVSSDDFGYFGKNGDKILVEETHDFSCYLKREYPGLPLILIGHSMGSLIARAYTKKYDEDIDMLVLSGSPSENKLAGLCKGIIKIIALFEGWHYRSNLIYNLVNGSFEKPFVTEGHRNAWICSDISVADSYNKDPLCGFIFTLDGYYALMNLMISAYSRDGWKKRNRNLKITFFSGSADPCRINDKAFHSAVNNMRKIGYPNVSGKLYPGLRHEILNERNKDKVLDDILQIIDGTVNSASQADM